MGAPLPKIWLVRHGETEWSVSGRHTGRNDIPLTPRGEQNARDVGDRLKDLEVAAVFTSPLQRARRTCELAGFAKAEALPDLMEWNYGEYEGLKLAEIRAKRPGWLVFKDGCPGGESPAEIGARADRIVARLRAVQGDALVFAHGHFLRVLTARWLGFPVLEGLHFKLSAGSVGILSYEHTLDEPAIELWNDIDHLRP
jgi:probable phosphoglycerate mutase